MSDSAALESSPRLAYLTAGAAGMYCGSCMRDNAMASALTRMGVDIQLIPTYTPIRTDEENVAIDRVFFGGLNVYLKDRFPLFRRLPDWVDWALDRPWLIQWLASRGMETSAKELGSLTLSMLAGEAGPMKKEVYRLAHWLRQELRPDVVGLTNILIGGLIPTVKRECRLPIVVTLQGDDLFLLDLIEPYRTRAIDRIREIARQVDAFVTFSQYYADFMGDLLQIEPTRIHVIPLGVRVEDFSPAEDGAVDRPPTLGYFARICPAKGFHHLVEAWLSLRAKPGFENVCLLAAGWLGAGDRAFFDQQVERIARAGQQEGFSYMGSVSREEKIQFFRDIDVLSVPTTYKEPKGLFVLEALASGVPVVQPSHGSFPELVESTGGGVLCPPENVPALTSALAEILSHPTKARELGRRGRAVVTTRYSAEQSARAYLEVVEKVWARPARHVPIL